MLREDIVKPEEIESMACTNPNCHPRPCPVCGQAMHLCEGCQEYHCGNSDCENYIG